jgi:hypothetical protein
MERTEGDNKIEIESGEVCRIGGNGSSGKITAWRFKPRRPNGLFQRAEGRQSRLSEL